MNAPRKNTPARLAILAASLLLAEFAVSAFAAEPPGVVIDRSPDFPTVYVGCPSIAIMSDGSYVASHSWFGRGTKNDTSEVFGSPDRGKTWRKLATLKEQWWSTVFVHRGALHMLGVTREYGRIVIRRSSDGGCTWTAPKDQHSGLLTAEDRYHCAPVPLAIHHGRIWRAFELAEGARPQWGTLVLSAPEDADLLEAANWRKSEALKHLWSNSQWIEGNVLVTPQGKLVNVLRTNGAKKERPEPDKAALVHVSDDGLALSHDRDKDLIHFPGGGTKFTIRYDPKTRRYWSIANPQTDPPAFRNVLALTSSPDLKTWKVETLLLRHADPKNHAWQYVDWQFDGDDLAAVSRTAWDGSHSAHDANYFTFHRFANFRQLTMADAVPLTIDGNARHESADLVITGSGFEISRLDEGATAFSNRKYIWQNLPEKFRGWSYTRTGGGESAVMAVRAKRDCTLHVATTATQGEKILGGWEKGDAVFNYSDKGKSPMAVFTRPLKTGQELVVPQGNWSGTLIFLPPEARP